MEHHATSPVRTSDGSLTLYNDAYEQTYHSRHGALTESRHVFLDASGVSDRLRAGTPTRVLEVGFGTGLNFLLTAQCADATHTPLQYVALERNLLPSDVLRSLDYGRLLNAPSLTDPLLAWRDGLGRHAEGGVHSLRLSPRAELTLVLGDATTTAPPPPHYDAVYLDAFSPDANTELWTEAFLARLHASMHAGARLTTYSVKGSVRRTLTRVGFDIEKRDGPPGGKREMLVATRPDE